MTEADFEDEDDDIDSSSPLMDMYIHQNGGNSIVKTMTPFNYREFKRLWDKVGVDFIVGMTNQKGPNTTTKPKDILFIILSVLKDPCTWDKLGANFGMSGQKAQRIVMKGVEVLAPLLKDLFTREVNKDSFDALRIRDCVHYPYVHHITDATVLEINRPAGTHKESKPYFSGKCFV